MLEHYGSRHLCWHSLSLFQVSFSCIILVSNMQTLKLTLHFDFISLYPELHPFALNHIFSPANEIALLKNNNHQISRLLSSNQPNFRKMEDNFCNFFMNQLSSGSIKYLRRPNKKIMCFSDWILRFQILIRWWLNTVSYNFGLKSYLYYAPVRFWNHSYDFRPNCSLFFSIILIINQSCNGTFKAQHIQARDKNVNIFKVIYLLQ